MYKSGWFYDDQVNNVMTSVTLHSNMWWDKEDGSEDKGRWVPWREGGKNGLDVDDDTFVNLVGMKNEGTYYGYGIEPIARSILTEDFNVSVFNTWTDFGNDFLSPVWNEVRQIAPYVKNLMNSKETLIENNKKIDPNNGFASKVMKKVGNLIEGAADFVSVPNAVQYLNKALVTQGTRFSYYGGTGFSFGNLGMKFTVFPKYRNGEVITVTEQMEDLYPYVMGKLEPFELKADVNGTTHDAANLLGEAYKGLLQWQSPPGGFESELKNIDIIQKGTLKLKIGPHYCLTNLVCQEANFTFSKQMVKFPVNGENKLSPLFCDVSLTLRPATLYSDIMMKKFVSGKANYIDNNKWKTSWVTKDMTEEEKSKLPADTVNTFEKEPIEEEQRNTSTNAILNKSLQEKISDFSSTYRQYK